MTLPEHWRITPTEAVEVAENAGCKSLGHHDVTLDNWHPLPGTLYGPRFKSRVDDANALEVTTGDEHYVCDLCDVPVRAYDMVFVNKRKPGGYHYWTVAVMCPGCSRNRVWSYSTKTEPDIHALVDCYVEGAMTEYGLERSYDELATQETLHEYLNTRGSRWYALKRAFGRYL